MTQEERIKKIFNLQVERVITQLDEIDTPEIVKQTVRKHFWLSYSDIIAEIAQPSPSYANSNVQLRDPIYNNGSGDSSRVTNGNNINSKDTYKKTVRNSEYENRHIKVR